MIIDDGVNEEYIGISTLVHNLQVLDSLEIIQRKNYNNAVYSHGSICAAIIKKYVPDCDIGSIKILDSDMHIGQSDQLILALEWCLQLDVSIINMSLGSIYFRDHERIRDLIARLIQKGSIIIAACHNMNLYSVPACLSGVIGVRTFDKYSDLQYSFNEMFLDQADFIASSRHMIRYQDKQIMLTPYANSYAAPMITGMVHNILKRNKEAKVCEVKAALVDMSAEIDDRSHDYDVAKICYSMRPDFMEAAIVINYSDCQFSNLFFFNVKHWYDAPDLTTLILPDEPFNLVILPPDKITWDDQQELELLKLIITNKKNIYGVLYGGVIPLYLANLCNEEIYCLIWDEHAYYRLPNCLENPAYKPCDIPIIRVYGDNIHITQVILSKLEREFYKSEYNVIKASDIKFSYLYGMEYIPESSIRDKVLRYLEELFCLDVILYAGHMLEDMKDDTLEDMTDNMSEDIQIIIREEEIDVHYTGNMIIVSSGLFNNNVSKIFDYIINFYDKQ